MIKDTNELMRWLDHQVIHFSHDWRRTHDPDALSLAFLYSWAAEVVRFRRESAVQIARREFTQAAPGSIRRHELSKIVVCIDRAERFTLTCDELERVANNQPTEGSDAEV